MQSDDSVWKADIEQKALKRLEAVAASLDGESMRGKILVLFGLLDGLLSEMLKRVLKPPRSSDEDSRLFGSMGPLESFSARTVLAYRMGLISEDDAHALDLLRRIRNDCAHRIEKFDLEAEPHCQRLIEFSKSTLQKDNLWLCMFGVICPKTTEELLMHVCVVHLLYMEATLANLVEIPNMFFVPPNGAKPQTPESGLPHGEA